jgi:hypothetical protein
MGRRMQFMDGWWAAGITGTARRHRLRGARESDGRRLAACGMSAPNGWVQIDELHTVECYECMAAALRAGQ